MSDKQDVGQIVKEYAPQLRSFIRKRVSSNEDAEDILQDVFYQLVRNVSDTLNPIEQVSAWLYRVARNMIINKGTKKSEQEMPEYRRDDSDNDQVLTDFAGILFDSDSYPSPEKEYLRSLVWEELESALTELPPEQRKIFCLTELDGIPVKEIARTSGIPVNTLLSRKHYAVKHLRLRLRELYQEIIYG